jgi:hypothetical protein
MQIVLIGLGLLLALIPVAMIKRLATGDSRSIRIVRGRLRVIAVFSGGGAMGCWVLTQGDAAITPQEGPMVIDILIGSLLVFLAAVAGSSLLGQSILDR